MRMAHTEIDTRESMKSTQQHETPLKYFIRGRSAPLVAWRFAMEACAHNMRGFCKHAQ